MDNGKDGGYENKNLLQQITVANGWKYQIKFFIKKAQFISKIN